jgi:hypothetical protein
VKSPLVLLVKIGYRLGKTLIPAEAKVMNVQHRRQNEPLRCSLKFLFIRPSFDGILKT